MRTRVATLVRGSVLAGAPLAASVVPLALIALPFVLACRPSAPAPSGDSLGTFVVHAALEESGCAPGFDPVDPLVFRVELSRVGRSLTWRMPGGRPVSGSLAEDGDFHVRTSTPVEAWPADPDTGVPGCTLSQVETVDGTITMPPQLADGAVQDDVDGGALDAGALDGGPPLAASFEATNRIEIVPVAGSDCSALLLVNGGGFPSLPCGARYRMDALVE